MKKKDNFDKTIAEGDKYAFNKKHILEEVFCLILWTVILLFEHSQLSYGWVWKIGWFFVCGVGFLWSVRIFWWLAYHVFYDFVKGNKVD